jgi:osmotically-inducible protein OsmY
MGKKSLISLTVLAMASLLSAADLDAEISRKVAKYLSSHSEYQKVTFTVEDEIVIVSGKVALWSQRSSLEWSLRRMEHVRKVENQVVLDPPPVSDEMLRARMGKALTAAGFAELVFQAHQGRVILRGSVRTRSQWARLQELAGNVDGVREVVNVVRVEE